MIQTFGIMMFGGLYYNSEERKCSGEEKKCCFCNGTITVGERYRFEHLFQVNNMCDDYSYTWYMHLNCYDNAMNYLLRTKEN